MSSFTSNVTLTYLLGVSTSLVSNGLRFLDLLGLSGSSSSSSLTLARLHIDCLY